jgi:hypothetical protein
MATLRSLLATYGALDQAIIQSDDPLTKEVVDRFLPGASANREWYRELEYFFFSGAEGDARDVPPDVREALTEIAAFQTATDVAPADRWTLPQQSRLFYAMLANFQLRQVAPPPGRPRIDDDPEFLRPFFEVLDLMKASQEQSFSGPEFVPWTTRDFPDALERLTEVSNFFTDSRSYLATRAFAVQKNYLGPEILQVPPCKTSIITVKGIKAVVVDTECESKKVSLNDLKNIVNPYNWHNNYPAFFCAMSECGPVRTDNWGNVLETVSFCDEHLGGVIRRLRTSLKYHPTGIDPRSKSARLDYDLNDPTPGAGDGDVTVDRGFINMWAHNPGNDPTQHGVKVRSRKVVHIKGIRPYAQGKLVCISGYGQAAAEFLFTAAENPPPSPEKYSYRGTRIPANTPATAPTDESAEPGGHFAPTAVKLLTDSVQEFTNDYFDLAEKWTSGNLGYQDLAEFSADVSGRLISAPLRFLEAMSQPRAAVKPGGKKKPGDGRPDDTDEGGDI